MNLICYFLRRSELESELSKLRKIKLPKNQCWEVFRNLIYIAVISEELVCQEI